MIKILYTVLSVINEIQRTFILHKICICFCYDLFIASLLRQRHSSVVSRPTLRSGLGLKEGRLRECGQCMGLGLDGYKNIYGCFGGENARTTGRRTIDFGMTPEPGDERGLDRVSEEAMSGVPLPVQALEVYRQVRKYIFLNQL